MPTRLSQFCDHFVSTLRPIQGPLGKALAVVEQDPESKRSGIRGELADLNLQVDSLCEKVAGQRSFVLIFGPLKSGKSTLMNAVAGAYVSEVSALPAYPCLVFVSHGAKTRFEVTDYNGDTSTFADSEALSTCIDQAHADLAEHIRAAEDAGEVFDPQQHFPSAIRRVDVHVDAPELAQSGAVLVDTPGLYTRMRFGYDRMTRDFRNAAACAVFVVKSDTLFLEQVFTEFNQLLELFSRIFLVVNMDTAKRDVGPDGQLRPSLEKEAPERIIEAFENLAMPTPLREAAKAGRVKLYPVDLMSAARDMLQGRSSEASGFASFHGDLCDYLASTEYLFAFLRDSLQRADHLLAEADQLAASEFAAQLRAQIEQQEEQRQAWQEELQRLDTCRKRDWDPPFAALHKELRSEIERASRGVGERVASAMGGAIETWMLSSHSLSWLLDNSWKPLVEEYMQNLLSAAQRCMEQGLSQADAGLDLQEEDAWLLRNLEIDLFALRRNAKAELDERQPFRTPQIPLDVRAIPIKRGVMDRLALRSEDKVRERLFGDPDQPDLKIPARLKASRLGEPARRYLKHFLLAFKDRFYSDTIEALYQHYALSLQKRCLLQLFNELDQYRPKLSQAIDKSTRQAEAMRRVLRPLEELGRVATDLRGKVHALSKQFAATDAEVLLEPMPPRSAEPQDAQEPDRGRGRKGSRSRR